jgi:RimJ/RimL family protein N-acetyltransferase
MTITIKKFKYSQSLELLKIYNSARIRNFFHKKNKINLKEHNNFLLNKLKKKDCIIYLAFSNKSIIGYVRYDKLKSNSLCEISIAILPKYYGKGYGSMIIKKTIKKIQIYKFKKIIAVVKKKIKEVLSFF